MRKKLDSHISHDDYLTERDLLEIKKENPSLFFEGEAFRVLMFSHPVDSSSINIQKDASFSKNLDGIYEYLWKQDLNYYKHLIIYKVDLYGLDINKAAEFYESEISYITKKEQEVVPLSISNITVLKEGSSEIILSELKK